MMKLTSTLIHPGCPRCQQAAENAFAVMSAQGAAQAKYTLDTEDGLTHGATVNRENVIEQPPPAPAPESPALERQVAELESGIIDAISANNRDRATTQDLLDTMRYLISMPTVKTLPAPAFNRICESITRAEATR